MKSFSVMLAIACVMMSIPSAGHAHLCNDVFAQADDNLAVKVDVRDGQLRIGETASFRVYLLNTMDRDIANINLEVRSTQFDSSAVPGTDWKGFPKLRTVKQGGKKEYFDITLKRKPGIPDGAYKIDLRLFNGGNPAQEFKTVDLGNACGTHKLKPAKGIAVDGEPAAAEWASSILCTDFYEVTAAGKYLANQRSTEQPRFRIAADATYLYCLLAFEGRSEATEDIATIYAAPTPDDEPRMVKIDRVAGKALTDEHAGKITVKKSADGRQLECRIPRALLGIDADNRFYLNLTRTTAKNNREYKDFWRGNPLSLNNPVVYDQFVVE